MIRILLADDHKVLRDGIQNLLSDQEDLLCVGGVSNGEEVLEFCAHSEVDIILMDINMPVMDGIETIKVMSKSHPGIKIIALTMLGQGSFIQQALKHGAKGFMLKSSGKEQLLAAIREVAQGNQYLGPEATRSLIQNLKGQNEKKREFIPRLTRREKEILILISEGHSGTEIAKRLFISFNTVESHRKNLIQKFGARNGAELIRLASERGML